MWEKICGLISIVVPVRVCLVTVREDVNVRTRACLRRRTQRLIVAILHPIREDGTSSASVRSRKKHV